ncbi:hypothetical protein JWV37_07815 [Sulfurospirillum sp. T05]|uniref:Uncharacterized protein n=1 Tax=Sulfurospirillum tamanense TaxID=2813362 RepID=A0ABS2WSN4_9BACT|nr:hypothetical protein [Sulfurospirillum tamanensis]MBN2964683.1 hypothetical protein [Sulfurospirillum tamanensis]
MLSRVVVMAGAILLLALSALFFALNSSYQDSIQGRVYYFLGDYAKANALSASAYAKDSYNKMAFTVLTQSTIALKYEAYITQGNQYLAQIDAISTKTEVSDADRSRIKLMCEIMIDGYTALSPTPLTDEGLQERAAVVYKKFKQLHKELF